MSLFRSGDYAVLIDSKDRRYLEVLEDSGEFHTHHGVVHHRVIIGQSEGHVVTSTKGGSYTVIRPSLEDFVLRMPRGAQVIYPKDLAAMCTLADVGPGMRVFEMLLKDWRQAGVTVLWVEHDLGAVGRLADRVTGLNRRVLFDDAPQQALKPERLLQLFSSHPQLGGEGEA